MGVLRDGELKRMVRTWFIYHFRLNRKKSDWGLLDEEASYGTRDQEK